MASMFPDAQESPDDCSHEMQVCTFPQPILKFNRNILVDFISKKINGVILTICKIFYPTNKNRGYILIYNLMCGGCHL